MHSTYCDEDEARKLSRTNQLYCPNCENFVIYKKGNKTNAHFAHKPQTQCVVTNYERETANHIKGKDVIFSWLKSKYQNSNVELEVYIPETQQIADVLVTHQSGDFNGERWAFEFQHSPISELEWEKRHLLYQEAGILDFWIFDAEVFIQYSTAQNVEHARLFKEPLRKVYKSTGFTNFLEISSQILTVDCRFHVRPIERTISTPRGRRTVENDYTFHDPEDNKEALALVEVFYDKDEHFAALTFPKIKEQFDWKFNRMIDEIRRQKENTLRNERRTRLENIFSYTAEIYSLKHAHVLKSFSLKNKSVVENDLLDLGIPEFIEKYQPQMEKLVLYLQEFDIILESEELADKVVADQAPRYQFYENSNEYENDLINELYITGSKDIYDKAFIDNVESLSYTLYERYTKEIENVRYVMDNHLEVLEKIQLRLTFERAKKILNRIDNRLVSWRRDDHSLISYALGYANFESQSEIDEIIKKVDAEFIVWEDPLRDYHDF